MQRSISNKRKKGIGAELVNIITGGLKPESCRLQSYKYDFGSFKYHTRRMFCGAIITLLGMFRLLVLHKRMVLIKSPKNLKKNEFS